ncbi:MAG: dihydrolipoamide acetyltransferase family protein [Halanaerobiales bacterium]|nr:dihydrolipoamide acetyltransferase family protein [Halanaerobiales bacterium]
MVDNESEIDDVKDVEAAKEKEQKGDKKEDIKEKPSKSEEKEVNIKKAENKSGEEKLIRISPRARKLAESEGINLDSLNEYTDRYRIIEKDVLNYLKEGLTEKQKVKEELSEDKKAGAKEYELVEVSQIRKATAENLTKSWQSPHAYLKKSIVVDKLIDYLVEHEEVSLNTAVTYLTAKTLKDNKFMNAHWLENEYKQFNQVNIGMAVAIKRGLVVPVLKKVTDYSLTGFSKKANELIEKAKNNKLEMDDMQEATFTVTNLGMYGIDEFTAVINPPQVGILSVGKLYNDFLIKDDGTFKVVKKINLVIGFDHRAVDGAQAAVFLNELEKKINSIDSSL